MVALINWRICMHACIHTYIHAYMHTHIYSTHIHTIVRTVGPRLSEPQPPENLDHLKW